MLWVGSKKHSARFHPTWVLMSICVCGWFSHLKKQPQAQKLKKCEGLVTLEAAAPLHPTLSRLGVLKVPSKTLQLSGSGEEQLLVVSFAFRTFF